MAADEDTETTEKPVERLQRDADEADSMIEVLDTLIEFTLKLVTARGVHARSVAAGDDPPSDEILLWERSVAEHQLATIDAYIKDIGLFRGRRAAEVLARQRNLFAEALGFPLR